MYMNYGPASVGVSVSRNQKAKLISDYGDLLKELSTPEIKSIGNYILGEDLGQGAFGKVKLATHILTGQNVAIKIIPKIHAEQLTGEIHHHRYLHHPNIISLLEVIPTETQIYMVLEYCKGGELFDLLNDNKGGFNEKLVRKMFSQLCKAVKYCHDRRIVHRDLKLENVLLDSNNNVKLGDFGFARDCEINQLLESGCGSPGYTAPEADIWSLGVILYTLLCGELPFDYDDEEEEQVMINKILSGTYEVPESLSDDDDKKDDDEDQWITTNEDAEGEDSISYDENSGRNTKKNSQKAEKDNSDHLNAVSYLEKQRQELFAIKSSIGNNHEQKTFSPRDNHYNNNFGKKTVPSAYRRYGAIQQQSTVSSSPPKSWGPSKSTKTSRRHSIDSKAFNEKVFFTSVEEKELLEKMEDLGLDVAEIKKSVLEDTTRIMVDVAIGTSDFEVKITKKNDSEKENIVIEIPDDNITNSRSSNDSADLEVAKTLKLMEDDSFLLTPPPKTYHAVPATRERRKSLVLAHPEAVEPVLTTITATASPPLSPKKYSSFTSPLSSRSVSWWGGTSHHPKDGGAGIGSGGYKKTGLNWPDNGAVVPSEYVRSRTRANRRSGSKTPPNYEANNDRRSLPLSNNSLRDKKKKRGSLQGSKGRRPNPLMIPPVTPSVVLSQNSPALTAPILGTPPARTKATFTINRRKPFAYPGSSSWGRKTVKRQSNGSINILLDNLNNAGFVTSENMNDKSDEIEDENSTHHKKSAIEISDDDVHCQSAIDKLTLNEQSKIIESSKSKTIILASPPPTPPPPSPSSSSTSLNRETEQTPISMQQSSTLSQPSKINHNLESPSDKNNQFSRQVINELSSDDEDSDVFVDACDFLSIKATSPSPLTLPSNSSSPIFKPDGTIMNPPSFPVPPPRSSNSSHPKSDSISSPVLSPIRDIDENNVKPAEISVYRGHVPAITTNVSIDLKDSVQINSSTDLLSTPPESPILPTTQLSSSFLKQSQVLHHKNSIQINSSIDLLSTPPESPILPTTPLSSSSFLKPPQIRHHHKPRARSSPLPLDTTKILESEKKLIIGSADNGKAQNGIISESHSKKDSILLSSSPTKGIPPLNASHRIFQMNNHVDRVIRRGNPQGSRFSLTSRDNPGNNNSSGLNAGRRPM
ncbi:3011_t:CDS:10 [Ambispora leptoticha]|uniref:3011_t:CDS:1 n=1 Tax=Ambispora leptoticha TaxID=144679 RepID=A0A9N9AK54_9GLOM|nr:3011_t:CDS:10 [Ambispora leptoticha]